MIAFSCPKCNHGLTRADSEVGTKVPCPSCGQRLEVPAPPKEDKALMGKLLPVTTDRSTAPSRPERLPRSAPPAGAIIRVACPHCQTTIKAPIQRAGTTASCPRCHLAVTIPGAMPQSVQDAPPVVVNVINVPPPVQEPLQVLTNVFNAAIVPVPVDPAPMPVQSYAHNALEDMSRRKQRMSTGLLAGVIVVAVFGVGILGVVLLSGGFKSKPQDLIVGKWEVRDATINKNSQMVFYKDGEVEFVAIDDKGRVSDGSVRLKYRFVDDTHIEVTDQQGKKPDRVEVTFPSADEMVTMRPGDVKVRFKRVK